MSYSARKAKISARDGVFGGRSGSTAMSSQFHIIFNKSNCDAKSHGCNHIVGEFIPYTSHNKKKKLVLTFKLIKDTVVLIQRTEFTAKVLVNLN